MIALLERFFLSLNPRHARDRYEADVDGSKERFPSSRSRGHALGLALVLLPLLGGGIWLTFRTAQQTDRSMRNRLLAQATAIARQVNVADIRTLAFDASDKERPRFQRLRAQMMAYARQALPLFGDRTKYLGIYSIARRGDAFCFGPESIEESDPRSSPPGTHYEEPPAEVAQAFASRQPQTVGPYTDEYGTFVSAFAPVLDPRSCEVVLVIGLDVEAAEWKAEVMRESVEPLGFTLALLLVALAGAWLVRQSGRQDRECSGWLIRHAAAVTVAAASMLLTLLLARVAHRSETRSHQETFQQLADAHLRQVEDWALDLRHRQLEGLGRFFDGSQTVDQAEFHTYAEHLTQDPAAQAWEWIPAVPAGERAAFEVSARAAGLTNFSIWEKDGEGRRVPAAGRPCYYPVNFAEPLAGNEVALGYDLGSDPVRAAGLETAAHTGLPTATAPVTLVQETGRQQSLLVFRPVFTSGTPRQLRGFALAAVRLGDMLQRTSGLAAVEEKGMAFVELQWLATKSSPVVLASTAPGWQPGSVPDSPGGGAHSFIAPLFVFGQTYALAAWPTPAFEALYGIRAGALAGLTGLGLGALLTAVVSLLGRRHQELETKVRRRTAELESANLGLQTEIAERRQAEEEKVKLQAQLTQAQKMESVGRLAGGVAHDFNNMLTAILGHTALALEELPPESPLRDLLEEVEKCAQRSADLTRQLLAFARKQTIAPKMLDLNETVAGMLKMLRRLIGEHIDLGWFPGADLGSVNMDPSQVDQILANLCVNARDAISGGVGKIAIETSNAVFDEDYVADHPEARAGEYVRLSVSDNGCGMSPEVQAHLFEPFYTTKGLGQGTGLGLATVYGIVTQNHGFIRVYSVPGRGTTFQIHLPRHTVRTVCPAVEASTPAPSRGHETILLVEDEPAILRVSQRVLENLGYRVLAARTPGEAIQLAHEHAWAIHLLMTDVVMPEMNGRELAKNLISQYPNLKRLFMSGYTADVMSHHGVLEPGMHFLQKPFSVRALANKVREALN